MRDDPERSRCYELCFAKQPALELDGCRADPDQVANLAADPAHAATVERLRDQLVASLREAGASRFTGGGARFDAYPFRGNYPLRTAGE